MDWKMSMDWTNLGVAGLILAFVTYLAKVVISKISDGQFQKFKTKLENKTEREMQTFKHKLEKDIFEHKTKFHNLNEKRFEIIAELYSKIAQANISMQNLIKPFVFPGEPSEKERSSKAFDALHSMEIFYQKNKIYLSETICGQMDIFIKENINTAFDFLNRKNKKSLTKQWQNIEKKFNNEIGQIKKVLEIEFEKAIK